MTDTFEAWRCPDCDNFQINADDCESCGYGVEEEGWDSVTVIENKEGELVEVG